MKKIKVTRGMLSELFELVLDINEKASICKNSEKCIQFANLLVGFDIVTVETCRYIPDGKTTADMQCFTFNKNQKVDKLKWDDCMNNLLYLLDSLNEEGMD